MPDRPGLSVIEQAVADRLASLSLAPGAAILDAPCGTGNLSRELRARGFRVSAADIDPAAAADLGDAFRRVDLGGPLPWSDGTFDAAVSVEGVEHLENRFAFARELRRVLRPGGLLVLTTPNVASLRSRVRFFGSGFFNQDPRPLREAARHPLHHIGLATFADLRYTLRTCGFGIAGVRHTHIKPISYAYAWLAPWMWVYTAIAFRKEKDAAQRTANREIRAALCSRSLLFGENLMIVARRDGHEDRQT